MAHAHRSHGQPVRPAPAPRLLSRLSHASKRSFLSHSSSFEADDERSSTASLEDLGRMSRSRSRSSSAGGSLYYNNNNNTDNHEDHGSNAPPPRYPGEDTRPTSAKELAGWYTYAFAAEVYVVCGQSSSMREEREREMAEEGKAVN